MNRLEKINRSFGSWYEGLFGNSGDDVRPKDILRRIFAAMEDYRKEHFDNRVYVPNQYILEISVSDEEEKEYLLSFINREELSAAIQRYCKQNNYNIRGALDVTIKEVADGDSEPGKVREKVHVRAAYSTKVSEAAPAVPAMPNLSSPPATASAQARDARAFSTLPLEERTVANVSAYGDGSEEEGTVPAVTAAALIVYAPDRPPFRFPIARGSVSIGRSPRSGNDIVVESDGQISKRHARLDMDGEGRFTLTDLSSTNGTKVNGRRIESRLLNDGDEILVGVTRLMFQQTPRESAQKDVDGQVLPTLREPAEAFPGFVFSHGAPSDVPGQQAAPPALTAATPGLGQGTYGGAAAALRGETPPAPSPEPNRAGRSGGNGAEPSVGGSSILPPNRVLRPRTARLVLSDGAQDVDDFLLASETLIGRGVTNDIVLPDRSIATRHARIVREDAGYALEALNDTEPTLLNGTRVVPHEPAPLAHGDRIALGDLTLRFEAGQ